MAIRLAFYVAISYLFGFYLGTLTVPEVTCVGVDKKIYCGRIISMEDK